MTRGVSVCVEMIFRGLPFLERLDAVAAAGAPAYEFWRWRSRSSGGRPRLSVETRDLIRSMSRDNVLWGPSGSAASC